MALKVKDSRRSNERKQAAIDEAVKEDLARLNMEIPESLHRRLKLQTIAEGRNVTLKSIIVRAATEYLEKYASENSSWAQSE